MTQTPQGFPLYLAESSGPEPEGSTWIYLVVAWDDGRPVVIQLSEESDGAIESFYMTNEAPDEKGWREGRGYGLTPVAAAERAIMDVPSAAVMAELVAMRESARSRHTKLSQ